jgi:N-terminal domain of anti-restriction factor ArdC
MLALMQRNARGIQAGPIVTFVRWKELGWHVRKGEKQPFMAALNELC